MNDDDDPSALYHGSANVVVRVSRESGLTLHKVTTESVDLPLEIALYLHFDTGLNPPVFERALRALREVDLRPDVPLCDTHLFPFVEEFCSDDVVQVYRRLPAGDIYAYFQNELRIEHRMTSPRTIGREIDDTLRNMRTH